MKKLILLITILFTVQSFSQSSIIGLIYDKDSKRPLPYATVKIISNKNYYTITNEDGKFEIHNKFAKDSLEIRFIGFKTTKIPISFFKEKSKFYLVPNRFTLNTISIVSDKDYVYNLLYNLIKKSRVKKETTKSKAFLTLSTSSNNVPIEYIEGFFNSEQSLSKGLIDLQIKSGRFGQNISFPFYSINNTDILNNFNLFNASQQILPQFPGNMTLRAIKSNYNVKMDKCNNCIGNDISISFFPKKTTGKYFQGSIIFDSESLVLKKIKLQVDNPETKRLSALSENDVMTPKEIKFNITFNPLNFNKIQHLEFLFSIYYKSGARHNTISSHSLLYFYDYDKLFQKPYFTKSINLKNDYDKIIALQASDKFWNKNYQFPKSFRKLNSINFLEKNGYLINFDSNIPSNYIEYIKPSVISWDKHKSISWNSIKEEKNTNVKRVDYSTENNSGVTKTTDKLSYSVSDLKHKKDKVSEELNFTYMLDMYTDENGQNKFTTRTLYDRNSSFCKYKRVNTKLIYINLIFDIYEIYNQRFKNSINSNMSFEEAKKKCNEKFEEATVTIKRMKQETNSGLNYGKLEGWETTIKQKINSEI